MQATADAYRTRRYTLPSPGADAPSRLQVPPLTGGRGYVRAVRQLPARGHLAFTDSALYFRADHWKGLTRHRDCRSPEDASRNLGDPVAQSDPARRRGSWRAYMCCVVTHSDRGAWPRPRKPLLHPAAVAPPGHAGRPHMTVVHCLVTLSWLCRAAAHCGHAWPHMSPVIRCMAPQVPLNKLPVSRRQ